MQGQTSVSVPFVKNGKTLLSGIDPIGRAEKTADSVPLSDRTLYFCPSVLYGYGLSRLLSRLETEAPDCAILCVEVDSELYKISIDNIESDVIGNKRLLVTNECDIEKLYALVCGKWGAMAFRNIEVIRFTGGYQLFPQVYDSLCSALRKETATNWSNALTLAKLGRLYIRNSLRNLSLTSHFSSIADLSFGSSPVLVLGAGPSLDETLDALNGEIEINRTFKIICVDTCLGALKERKIVPDLAVILESQHWNMRDFIGLSGWNIPAAVDLSSLPAAANRLGASGYLFFTPWTPLRIFERLKAAGLLPASIMPLGSVGLTAVEIARRLTSGNIICAGLDFSFTADKYHARSTPGHRSKLNSQTRFLNLFNTLVYNESSFTAVSKSGFPAQTNPAMKNYRALFEQEFSGDSRIYDIEGTGLPLGVKTLKIEEAMNVLKLEKEDFSQRRRDRKERREEFCPASFSSTLIPSVIPAPPCLCERSSQINSFIENEIKLLEELRGILTGETAMDSERLFILITECDYLWAHFPDCAGGRKPNPKDESYLKRVRAEIDPMLKLLYNMGTSKNLG